VTSFTEKQLRTTFTLGDKTATFQGTAANQLVLAGMRTVASLQGALGYLWQMDLQVYGMRQQDMNALSVIGVLDKPTQIGQNSVLLEGNQGDGSGWFKIFDGIIIEGGPEYRTMPEVYFHCQAVPGAYYAGQQPTAPLSYKGSTSIVTIAGQIASKLGVQLKTNGVSGTLPNGGYFPKTPIDQLDYLKSKSGTFDYTIDPGTNTLNLFPVNQQTKQVSPRSDVPVLVISPSTGLIGYPTAEVMGIGVVALFHPTLLNLGTQFHVTDSEIAGANGYWLAYQQSLALEAFKLGGNQWFASMHCLAAAALS
jgi:hypothetical protein